MADDSKKPSPAWLEPGGNRGERTRRSRKSEEKFGARFGGKRLRRSGGAPWTPGFKATDRGDVSIPGFHVEHKETEAESIGVKREWFKKVEAGALRVAKDPALAIKFVRNGPTPDEEWVAVPVEVFKRLLRACGVLYEE